MRTRKSAKAKRASRKSEKIELSSGNVFADLGFEDSEERLLKAKLASKIAQLIDEKAWAQAALDQPKLSRLLRGSKHSNEGPSATGRNRQR